jgi:hypothetical protein
VMREQKSKRMRVSNSVFYKMLRAQIEFLRTTRMMLKAYRGLGLRIKQYLHKPVPREQFQSIFRPRHSPLEVPALP